MDERNERDVHGLRTLCVIPARGGSKGIPRKNLQPLAGRPLLAHAIGAALASRWIERVVVSTEDPEIAEVAKRYGAQVWTRPQELAGDTASSESALLSVLEGLDRSEGERPDLLVFVQCTAPLLLSEDIDGTIQTLLDEDADTAFAVSPFHRFLWARDAGGDVVGINHDKRTRLMRQQRAPDYLEAGAVYVMRTPGFVEARHRFFGKTAIHVVPRERCVDIEEPLDLRVAEFLIGERSRTRHALSLPQPLHALVLDFDGVLTDNRVVVFQDGTEAVVCSRGEGRGLRSVAAAGIPVFVVSAEVNPVVRARCDKLALTCYQGVTDKRVVLAKILTEQGFEPSQVVFVGNDIDDLECMRLVGCAAAPADAHPQVLAETDIVLSQPGGRGAVTELCDLILQRHDSKHHHGLPC